MKLLSNQAEYREWMVGDYLQLNGKFSSVFSHDELEILLINQMSREFPCLINLVKGPNIYEPESITFIYRSEVEEWAKLFGIN